MLLLDIANADCLTFFFLFLNLGKKGLLAPASVSGIVMTGLVETDAAFMPLNRAQIVTRDGGWRMEEENLMSSSNVCRLSATGEHAAKLIIVIACQRQERSDHCDCLQSDHHCYCLQF